MKWLLDRFREPSTAAGLGLAVTGIVTATGGDEHAAAVGQAVTDAATAAGSGDWFAMIPAILGGAAAVFFKEGPNRT